MAGPIRVYTLQDVIAQLHQDATFYQDQNPNEVINQFTIGAELVKVNHPATFVTTGPPIKNTWGVDPNSGTYGYFAWS